METRPPVHISSDRRQNQTTERITLVRSPLPYMPGNAVALEVDLGLLDNGSKVEVDVDFGWPEDKKDGILSQQRLTLQRPRLLGDPDDLFELRPTLNPATNSQVRLSIRASSWPDTSKIIIFDRVIQVSASGYIQPVKFRLSSLGPIGYEILSNGHMDLEVQAVLLAETVEIRRTLQQPVPSLAMALRNSLENEELTQLADVELVASDGTSHPAHKLLLCIRSPVFRAMFRHDMQESRTGRCKVEASSAAVVELLIFVYTDDIKQFTEMDRNVLMDVYDLGYMYDLPRLQKLAEFQLLSMMSTGNVADLLMLSAKYDDSPLQSTCISMIKANLSAVMKTDGWKHVANDPLAMAAIFNAPQDTIAQEEGCKRQRYE